MCFSWPGRLRTTGLDGLEHLLRRFGPILAPWMCRLGSPASLVAPGRRCGLEHETPGSVALVSPSGAGSVNAITAGRADSAAVFEKGNTWVAIHARRETYRTGASGASIE